MATCSVIDLGFKDLWKKGVLKNGTTRIEDLVRFNTLNQLYSDLARSKHGVTNPGLFFDINVVRLSHTGPLNVYSHKGANTFAADFAVVNREFVDEFQEKFIPDSQINTIIEQTTTLIPNLQKTYDSIKNGIIMSSFTGLEKGLLQEELNTSRTISDFNELLKKLC